MKILFVCGGGVIYGKERVTLSLMEGLRARGHQIHCITSTWGDVFAKELAKRSIPYDRLPTGFISKTLRWEPLYMTLVQLWRLPKLWQGYRSTLRRFGPNVIIHSNFHHLLLLWPLLDPKRTFFHVHDYFKPTALYCSLMRFLNLRIRAFIGVSRFIRDAITQLGISPSKVFFVHNGIDFEDRPNHRTLSAPVRIGIVGQIGEWKGHDDLLEALKILKDWNMAFVCKIFGEGEPAYLQTLHQRSRQYGLDSNIRWLGYVKDKHEIFKEIDICVIPSRCHEGFAITAVEAAVFGVPVAATRMGALTEVVRNEETGYLIRPDSPLDLAQKLKGLIENPSLRKNMGERAYLYAKEHFSRERMSEGIETILSNLTHV